MANETLLNDFMGLCQTRVEQSLERVLPKAVTLPNRLHEAMRYATLGGGKRIRPILVYASGQAAGVEMQRLDFAACAVELIHTYSLVHDDLPAMDNDELRRGQPTCHRAYDEATAILVGDALQTLAFQVLTANHRHPASAAAPRCPEGSALGVHEAPGDGGNAAGLQEQSLPAPAALGPSDAAAAPGHPAPAALTHPCAADTRLAMVECLARASGSRGMAGGQALDLAAIGQSLNLTELENLHIHKTGALIRASVRLGAMCNTGLEHKKFQALDHYAKCIGLAFQIQDDILDVAGSTETLGKTQGKDQAHDKPTYPSLLGLSGSREKARELQQMALESLNLFQEEADPLRWLAHYITGRDH